MLWVFWGELEGPHTDFCVHSSLLAICSAISPGRAQIIWIPDIEPKTAKSKTGVLPYSLYCHFNPKVAHFHHYYSTYQCRKAKAFLFKTSKKTMGDCCCVFGIRGIRTMRQWKEIKVIHETRITTIRWYNYCVDMIISRYPSQIRNLLKMSIEKWFIIK